MSAYRQSPFANLTPVVKNLLIINVIFFLAYMLLDHGSPRGPVTTLFGEYYFDSSSFRPWQFITYMFMHGGFEHIFFNMFALFSFGPILEYSIGSKRFLNFYFICGIGAGILQMFVQAMEVHSLIGSFTLTAADKHTLDQLLIPDSLQLTQDAAAKLYGIYHAPLVGASGAIFGILVAFGMLYPNMDLMMLFIPFPIKAKYLVGFYVLLEIYLGFRQNPTDSVAHFAHIGGALLGFLMVRIWRLRGPGSY
ncbi:rhomboid family intramembrane serine protease [Mucilaginibacter sp. L3T2-6]|uniref:rhomboid family intramembrane serine protease n=1 Tax=Mucilaginibacter sp. L3T2-6 TaxID=3062491 RepID=UPI0026756700|nr:rhomboid family intramembrane serine protease [Mucilaginibacter sp. L3T2-6]MDO3644559.1 rhomboid family intramembrane serine protease [Mucilaginibacter sp. L3T2-6]MDV6217069.1 rhomboid family intramembrane serine protease [Mucilaginibacter sp. L3T2-6]